MNLSLALTSLFLGANLDLSNADGPATWVRERLEDSIALNGMGDINDAEHRRLQTILNQDFSEFVGSWYNCLHTSLMTFGGENAPKHVVEQVGCDGGLLGEVTRVGNNDQSMQMDVIILNHCFFHDLGGPGQPPCPDDFLASDDRGPGNVLVKYQFFGIGSFAEPNKIHMVSDHTFLVSDSSGDWVANMNRAKLENKDTMTCQKYLDGIVCDWRINEYRTGSRRIGKKCQIDGVCKPNMSKAKCRVKRGEWTEDCGEIEYTPNGFVYDSFGSYYLVKNTTQCNAECATDAPTIVGQTQSPELRVPGCYQGGACDGKHGCCDCSITEADDCDETFLEDGCGRICHVPTPEPTPYPSGTDAPTPYPSGTDAPTFHRIP